MIQDAIKILQKASAFSLEAKEEFPMPDSNLTKFSKRDVAILTSSAKEFNELIQKLDNVRELKSENDDSIIYYLADLKTNKRRLEIVVPYPTTMGIEGSVNTTSKTISYFSPELILMCGICAGNKRVTNIGDLIIAEKSVNYNNVVEIEKDTGKRKKFMQSADSINKNLKARLSLFASNGAFAMTMKRIDIGSELQKPPSCQIGMMVTGSSLLRSNQKMDEINDSYHGVKGMDMETHGFYFAATNSSKSKVGS